MASIPREHKFNIFSRRLVTINDKCRQGLDILTNPSFLQIQVERAHLYGQLLFLDQFVDHDDEEDNQRHVARLFTINIEGVMQFSARGLIGGYIYMSR